MRHPFFPDPVFAWTFYGVLVGLMVLATYTDLRRLVIPKALTLSALVLGVLFNVARGAWVSVGEPAEAVWVLGANGGFVGALDGLLFSLAGFATGFALFFLMWILGTCGGGDVKLFAAVGAWVGPLLTVYLLGGTLVLVIFLSFLRLAWIFLSHGAKPAMKNYSTRAAATAGKKAGKQGYAESRRTRQRLMAYSLPVALSTAMILLWVFRAELALAGPAGDATNAQVNARP